MKQENPSLKQRLHKLEQVFSSENSSRQTEVSALRSQLVDTNKILAAVIRVVGEEVVQKALQDLVQEAKVAREDAQKKSVSDLVGAGVLTPAECVVEDGFIVGLDITDGDSRRVQFEVSAINPQFRALYLSKKPGDTVNVNNTSLLIQEVYCVDVEKARDLYAKNSGAVPPPAEEQKCCSESECKCEASELAE